MTIAKGIYTKAERSIASKKGGLLVRNPKTFNYRGHRYTILRIFKTSRAAEGYSPYGMTHRSFLTAVKQLADGRWAVGVRK